VSGPVLETLAAESLLQNARCKMDLRPGHTAGLCALALIMMLSWRRVSAAARGMLLGMTVAVEAFAICAYRAFPLILDTSLFILRSWSTSHHRARRDRYPRSARPRRREPVPARGDSLGDGLICTDQLSDHGVESGCCAIFGYQPDEMIGRPFDAICARDEALAGLVVLDPDATEVAAGTVIEFDGRRSNGEVFPVEASSPAGRARRIAVRRDPARLRCASRGRTDRYLAEYDSLTGLINRNTLHAKLAAMIAKAETMAAK